MLVGYARVSTQDQNADLQLDVLKAAVWKLDCLARSLKQLIETVELLDNRNIGFLSLTEAIDTTTAGGKLVFHIFGSLAEFERSIIKEPRPDWMPHGRGAG